MMGSQTIQHYGRQRTVNQVGYTNEQHYCGTDILVVHFVQLPGLSREDCFCPHCRTWITDLETAKIIAGLATVKPAWIRPCRFP